MINRNTIDQYEAYFVRTNKHRESIIRDIMDLARIGFDLELRRANTAQAVGDVREAIGKGEFETVGFRFIVDPSIGSGTRLQ